MLLSRDATPRRADKVHVEHRPDGSVLVETGSGRVELNAEAAALLWLCDGETKVAEIVAAATVLFTSPAGDIEVDVLRTLVELQREGVISTT